MSTNRELSEHVSADDLAMARKFGVTDVQTSEGRWRPVLRAAESRELALLGDYQLLAERIESRTATDTELKLNSDLLHRRVNQRKKSLKQLLDEDRRTLIADYVRKRQRQDLSTKLESIVKGAAEHFCVKRSSIFAYLRTQPLAPPEGAGRVWDFVHGRRVVRAAGARESK